MWVEEACHVYYILPIATSSIIHITLLLVVVVKFHTVIRIHGYFKIRLYVCSGI